MKHKLVTLTRAAWKDLIANACGHAREGGGVLLGDLTRYGNYLVKHVTVMMHAAASKSHVRYNPEERIKARRVASEAFELPILGEWHTHPWPAYDVDAIAPQISDDWSDPNSDVREMEDGELEVIVATFPSPGYKIKSGEYRIMAKVGDIRAGVEAWLRVKQGEVEPCGIKVRG